VIGLVSGGDVGGRPLRDKPLGSQGTCLFTLE
jgi:hypothetical protein